MDIYHADHEIPKGSKLYFGKSADIKREFEYCAAKILKTYDYKEIVTPYFSYHQDLVVSFKDRVNLTDSYNQILSLRADSTVDVVRIVRQRFKDKQTKRLFYIQPVFKYPNKEIYQIGAESIGKRESNLALEIVSKIFDKFKIELNLQISHIKIPQILCSILGLDMEIFKDGSWVGVLRDKKIGWVDALIRLSKKEDLAKTIELVPQELKESLVEMKELVEPLNSNNLYLMPLYYSKMNYYDRLFFRFFDKNEIYCSGGGYEIEGMESSGFGIMVDSVVEKILENKGNRQ